MLSHPVFSACPPIHGGLTDQTTDTYVKRLGTEKRYVRDIY